MKPSAQMTTDPNKLADSTTCARRLLGIVVASLEFSLRRRKEKLTKKRDRLYPESAEDTKEH
jgi:predicted lipoprotein